MTSRTRVCAPHGQCRAALRRTAGADPRWFERSATISMYQRVVLESRSSLCALMGHMMICEHDFYWGKY